MSFVTVHLSYWFGDTEHESGEKSESKGEFVVLLVQKMGKESFEGKEVGGQRKERKG